MGRDFVCLWGSDIASEQNKLISTHTYILLPLKKDVKSIPVDKQKPAYIGGFLFKNVTHLGARVELCGQLQNT